VYHPYNDQDDAFYLKVAARFVQPVGHTLEWILFRPMDALMGWTDPDPDRYAVRFPHLQCDSERPQRGCTAR
jgi:hypothetical protein